MSRQHAIVARLIAGFDIRSKMGKESRRICLEKFEINRVNDFFCQKKEYELSKNIDRISYSME